MIDSLKQRVFTNWNVSRVIRLIMGLWLIVWSIRANDWTITLFSGLFIFMAVSNTGCCGAAGCAIPKRNGDKTTPASVDYEEINNKQKLNKIT